MGLNSAFKGLTPDKYSKVKPCYYTLQYCDLQPNAGVQLYVFLTTAN